MATTTTTTTSTTVGAIAPATLAAARLRERNRTSAAFFPGECERLARACKEMAERFSRGGRLLAFGREQLATDAQHVSVEFVHPVVVGKRALPALDLSPMFRGWLASLLRREDIVMGFGPPAGDPEVDEALGFARARGAQTFALPGSPRAADDPGDASHYALAAPSPDPYIHQELIEIVYHTLWETVHVFFEHREMGHEVGKASFLYPYLGQRKQDTGGVLTEVAASILMKTRDDERLRAEVAGAQAEQIARVAAAIRQRVAAGGKLILFGNGGSATDANDWALDCAAPRPGWRPIPAVSLAMEPAILSAIANDVGPEAIFLRQLIAHAGPHDVAVAISTSGGSANILAALEEARKRGLLTVALLGYDGGETLRRGLADFPLVVPCDYIPRIQEVQASIYHVLLELLEADGHGRAA
ncbi:MAG TPA: SIS domain-containing protein [Thermoanaerobaculia bacterium]|nr:SIS domain-containing protein [Thermoanaerobaculia bacterium]